MLETFSLIITQLWFTSDSKYILDLPLFEFLDQMGSHSQNKRKEYKKRRKQKIKELLGSHQDVETNEQGQDKDLGDSSSEEDVKMAERDASQSNIGVREHFKRDILYTSMIKFMESRRHYNLVKQTFKCNHDILLLAPDRDRYTGTK